MGGKKIPSEAYCGSKLSAKAFAAREALGEVAGCVSYAEMKSAQASCTSLKTEKDRQGS
jgi:hypothetical protein